MAITGRRKEFVGYTQKVGFFQAEIIAINPTLEQMSGFMDISNSKEPEYNRPFTDKEQNEFSQAVTTFYLQWHDGTIKEKRFPIIDKIRMNKEGTKTQFINDIGNTTWAVSKEALQDSKFAWFTKRPFREALTGEEKLYNFLQKWLSLDWKDIDTTLSIDTAPLFKGKYKELQDLLKVPEFKEAKIVGYATIKTSIGVPTEENPEPAPKTFQNIWDEFLPGNAWRYLHIEPVIGSTYDVPLWKTTLPNWIQDYVNTMIGDYGSKDFLGKTVDNQLQIQELADYDPKDNPVANSSSFHGEEANSGYTPNNGSIVDDLPF